MFACVAGFFFRISSALQSVLMFDVLFFVDHVTLPFVVFWFLLVSCYFFVRLRAISFVRFLEGTRMLLRPEGVARAGSGGINSKVALLSSISGVVGLGNITGISAAVYFSNPGVIFWFIVATFLGMSVRYVEVVLGHYYRGGGGSDGEVDGALIGPFSYVFNGLRELNYGHRFVAFCMAFFAISLLMASLGASIMQFNPTINTSLRVLGADSDFNRFIVSFLAIAVVMMIVCSGFSAIVGFLRHSASVVGGIYLSSVLFVLVFHFRDLPAAFKLIFISAMNLDGMFSGGVLGLMFLALQRVLVSSEFGFGTITFFHGKSLNSDSDREGLIAMSGIFYANLLVLVLTGLMITVTGAYKVPGLDRSSVIDVIITAFSVDFDWLKYVLLVSMWFIALTTIIAWYYYAKVCLSHVGRSRFIVAIFSVFYFAVMFFSGFVDFGFVLGLIDATTLFLIFPNLVICYLLFGVVRSVYFSKV